MKLNPYDNAYRRAEILIQLDTVFKTLDNKSKIKLKKVYVFLQENELLTAESVVKSLLVINWFNEDLHVLYAQIKLAQGRYLCAKGILIKKMKLFPNNSKMHELLGDIYYIFSNYNDSKKMYKKALVLSNPNYKLFIKLGQVYHHLGEVTKAISAYKRVIQTVGENQFINQVLQQLEIEKQRENSFISTINVLYVVDSNHGLVNPVQVITFKGHGDILCTGNTSEIIKESCFIAWNYLKANQNRYTLPRLNELSIHVNFPHLEIFKDGPSAGLAIVIGIYSSLLRRKVSNEWTFTGEIDVNGNVSAIGGLKPKIEAAYMLSKKKVIFPRENFNDLHSLTKKTKNSITLVPVNNIQEVIHYYENNS